jgi:quinol monooxygenase YgiN
MYIVTVNFQIKPAHLADFRREMLKNASTSLREESGCSRFDVAEAEGDPAHIFLYEIYDDAAAFQHHLASAHFKQFSATVSDWISSKQVTTFTLLPQETER